MDRQHNAGWWVGSLCLGMMIGQSHASSPIPANVSYVRKDSWVTTLLASREALRGIPAASEAGRIMPRRMWEQMEADFPVQCDWLQQDLGGPFSKWFETRVDPETERGLISRVLGQLSGQGSGLSREFDQLGHSGADPADPRWLRLYARACEQRRADRLQILARKAPRIVFTKHRTVRPSFFAYTEGQSDAQDERHFVPGATLCLLEWDGAAGRARPLLDDPTGAIRDPAVSYDGGRVLFAWKKSLREDDYHLYEMDLDSGKTRQVTFGLGFADYEPSYLPNGDIIFASTRCVQTVDCWWTEVSNLYTCDGNGRFLRRLGFDQVHSVFPTVTDDGRVIYTRWDYNDRGQVFPQPLFQMNPDGTGQTEFYGNNSWFPTTIAHARGVPSSQKVVAILCGHHSTQAGKLAVIDPARGRQENRGVQLVAPVRETRAERIDSYGQAGELFQYPYPLSETEFLVTYAPLGWEAQDSTFRRAGDAHFGIYWMDLDGRRELLVSDPSVACQQAVPVVARAAPPPRPSTVDYRKQTGTYYLQDVYAGPGLASVPRGVVKRLRVVALEFRPAGVGNNGSSGPGGGALISTPVAVGNGSWDVKVVLGDARVYEDGSAFFTVPARTPVYFQAIDDQGQAIQTMRSWSTLQPGENQACVGCHEHKNTAPLPTGRGLTLGLRHGAQALDPFHGPARGFSFPREIQPILDRHCISCHNDRKVRMKTDRLLTLVIQAADPDRRPASARVDGDGHRRPAPAITDSAGSGLTNKPAFSLLRDQIVDPLAKRKWSDSYLNLVSAEPAGHDWDRGAFAGACDGRVVNWIGSQSIPAPLPPYAAGACRSELVALLERGHGGVKLSREEMEKIACWIDLYVPYCGDYVEANAWTEAEMKKFERYLEKRKRMAALEAQNIEEFIANQAGQSRVPVVP
jgi:hypothetical protein